MAGCAGAVEMTNRIALALALFLAAILLCDAALFDSRLTLFLAREFIAFIEYLSFWR